MKNIFVRNVDIDKTAYMNWRFDIDKPMENFIALAEGYIIAADCMIDSCIKNNSGKKADILIFPILFSINHAIELYLKSIIWIINEIAETDKKIEGGHDIKQIYESAYKKIREVDGIKIEKGFEKIFHKETEFLRDYINELYQKIRTCDLKKTAKLDFSRYPIDNMYKSQFYIETNKNEFIDLDSCKEIFSKISSSLSYISGYLMQMRDFHREQNINQ